MSKSVATSAVYLESSRQCFGNVPRPPANAKLRERTHETSTALKFHSGTLSDEDSSSGRRADSRESAVGFGDDCRQVRTCRNTRGARALARARDEARRSHPHAEKGASLALDAQLGWRPRDEKYSEKGSKRPFFSRPRKHRDAPSSSLDAPTDAQSLAVFDVSFFQRDEFEEKGAALSRSAAGRARRRGGRGLRR